MNVLSKHLPLAAATILLLRTPSLFACDLALVVDQSGSMADSIRSTHHTRAADAACYATTVFNYYRCGASTCSVTTADTPLDAYIDGSTSTFDIVYLNPSNNCNSVAGKRVNVYAFNDVYGLHSVTTTISPSGWVSLSNNANADAVLDVIHSLSSGAIGGSPIADSLCDLVTAGDPTLASARLKLITDGGENASAGPCSGPDDSDGIPPFDASSWQGKVFAKFLGSKWSVDTTLLVPSPSQLVSSGAAHPLTDIPRFSAHSPAKDSSFFTSLSNATFGKTVSVPDDQAIAPPCGTVVPAPLFGSLWILVTFAMSLLVTGSILLTRPHFAGPDKFPSR